MKHIQHALIAFIFYLFIGFIICYVSASIVPFGGNEDMIYMGLFIFCVFLIASIILSKIDDLKHDK